MCRKVHKSLPFCFFMQLVIVFTELQIKMLIQNKAFLLKFSVLVEPHQNEYYRTEKKKKRKEGTKKGRKEGRREKRHHARAPKHLHSHVSETQDQPFSKAAGEHQQGI